MPLASTGLEQPVAVALAHAPRKEGLALSGSVRCGTDAIRILDAALNGRVREARRRPGTAASGL
jgi:hypothetical protein